MCFLCLPNGVFWQDFSDKPIFHWKSQYLTGAILCGRWSSDNSCGTIWGRVFVHLLQRGENCYIWTSNSWCNFSGCAPRLVFYHLANGFIAPKSRTSRPLIIGLVEIYFSKASESSLTCSHTDDVRTKCSCDIILISFCWMSSFEIIQHRIP